MIMSVLFHPRRLGIAACKGSLKIKKNKIGSGTVQQIRKNVGGFSVFKSF